MAGQLIPQIKELAKISPLTMSDMVGAEKMMLGFNIQAEDTIKYLKAISDISMGESSKFNSLTLAFSQMSAAGKLIGQDLNQMINAGFNPLQIISEKTGKSIATLKLKPVDRAEFFHAMDRAVDQCRRTRAGMVPVWTEDGSSKI